MERRDGTVPKVAFEVTTWTLFCIAIAAAIIRLAFRVRSKGRLFIDDVLLAFACLTLILASIILQIELGTIYIAEELTALYMSGKKLPKDLDIPAVTARYHIVQDGHGALCWLTVFSVKFSFLFFFRRMVDKIPRLEYYWKWVLGLNGVACLYCLLSIAADCPYQSLAAFKCIRPSFMGKTSGLVGAGIGADILTDLLIVSIPIIILWKVRMQLRQKIGIGVFLCLSICMITIASIRLSKIHIGGTTVSTWQYFWLEIETSAAVCMVSLTAFRSFFVDNGKVKAARGRRWYSSTIARNLERRNLRAQLQEHKVLLTVPLASFSDMHSYLRKSWLGLERLGEIAYGQLEAGSSNYESLHNKSGSAEDGIRVYHRDS